MQKYLSSSLNSIVSIDLESSWASRSLQEALKQARFDANNARHFQARFQQKQIQEREEKLLKLYESQQQKAFERVNRGSAGSNASVGSNGGGKVRQMFDERRQKAGIDKSYPLEPLKTSKTNRQIRTASIDRNKNAARTVHKGPAQIQARNGQQNVDKQEMMMRSIYNNNDGDESFHEYNLNKTFNKTRDIVEMMNNQNFDDSLDNEEMPDLGYDESDEPMFVGKLANLGGKLPSENFVEKPAKSALGKTFRKETKPVIRRTAKPAPNLSASNSAHSRPPKSPPASPLRSQSQTMSSTKAASGKRAPPQPPQAARTPCNTRPSARQSAKSPVVRDDLNECKFCGRRFAADRLEVHEAICGKTGKKKRKTYDATKHRVEGTELEQYVRRGTKAGSKPAKQPPSKKDWRRTHEEFISAIRAAKEAQAHVAKGGKLSDLPPPPPSSNPDYVQCPHCGRKFNEAAAERHIPKCASYQFNKPKQGAQKGKVAGRG